MLKKNQSRWMLAFIWGMLGVYLAFSVYYDFFQNKLPAQWYTKMLFMASALLVIGIYLICTGYLDIKFCKKFKHRPDYTYVDARDGRKINILGCIKYFEAHPVKDIEYDDEKKIAKVKFYW